jgi:hypothetical protein
MLPHYSVSRNGLYQVCSWAKLQVWLEMLCCFAGTFDILVYADDGADVPATWVDTQDRLVPQAAVVDLRKFRTGVHTVDASVFFRNVVHTS